MGFALAGAFGVINRAGVWLLVVYSLVICILTELFRFPADVFGT